MFLFQPYEKSQLTVSSVWMCSQNTGGGVCLCGSREGTCSWLIIQHSLPDPPRISLLYLRLPADADSNIFVGLGGPLRRPPVPKTVIALQVSNLLGQTLNPLQMNSLVFFFSSRVEARARCKAAAKLCSGLRCLSIRRLPYTADSFSCCGNLSHATAAQVCPPHHDVNRFVSSLIRGSWGNLWLIKKVP